MQSSNKENLLESTDKQDNGAIVTFADGSSAFYSAALLRSIFAQAEQLKGTAEDAHHDLTWKKSGRRMPHDSSAILTVPQK
jgi:hypothetical protein